MGNHPYGILILVGLTQMMTSRGDPCRTKTELPHLNIRYPASKINTHSDEYMDDYHLKKGWYKVGNKHMVQTFPGTNRCGTVFPIYMKGDIDIADGQEVTRGVCAYDFFTDSCRSQTKNITIKNCTNYNVYKLNPTEEFEAYCFEERDAPPVDDTEIEPTEKITQKPLAWCMLYNTSERMWTTYYSCGCNFTALADENLFYQVYWYGNGFRVYVSEQVQYKDIASANLHEDHFGEIGISITCHVKISKKKFGLTGPSSPRSDEIFIGIKTNPESLGRVVVKSGEKIKIPFNLTMPFGCNFLRPSCHLTLAVVVSDVSSPCSSKLAVLRDCSLKIEQQKWNQVHFLEISTKRSTEYKNKEKTVKWFDLRVETQRNRVVQSIWGNYRLPLITIEMHDQPQSPVWEGKGCYAVADPNMGTFDRFYYPHQTDGTYTLYRNSKTRFGVLEVQVRVVKCSIGRSGYCVCGIAVRAGRDVYKIDRCNSHNLPVMKFLTCDSDYIDIKKVNYRTYKIYLPTGTYINVRQNNRDRHYDVSVYPSPSDVNSTEGLCGLLNGDRNDDLVERGSQRVINSDALNRKSYMNRNPNVFINSWRVSDTDNLLTKNSQSEIEKCLENDKVETVTLCECNDESIECSGSEIAEDCKNKFNEDKVEKRCKRGIHYARARRFAHQPNNIVPNYQQIRHHQRIKREEAASILLNVTEKDARSYCEHHFRQSPSVGACESVPHVDSEPFLQQCVSDSVLSQTLNWVSAAREGLKGICIKELQQNGTLQKAPNDGVPSLAEQIFEIACPNECSGNGICNNGTCQCQGTYGGADCALDLTEPPIVNGINIDEGGLCDVNDCDTAFVFGDNFIDSGGLMCMRTHFEIDINNTVSNIGQDILAAVHQTITEIQCTLSNLTSKQNVAIITRGNPFVRKMMIAISNDGNIFGDNHTLFILDSKCQDTYDNNGTLLFALKGGWCFIEGHCIANEDVNKNDSSKICAVSKNRFSWSDVPTTPVPTTMETTSESSSSLHVTTIPVTSIELDAFSELLTTTGQNQNYEDTSTLTAVMTDNELTTGRLTTTLPNDALTASVTTDDFSEELTTGILSTTLPYDPVTASVTPDDDSEELTTGTTVMTTTVPDDPVTPSVTTDDVPKELTSGRLTTTVPDDPVTASVTSDNVPKDMVTDAGGLRITEEEDKKLDISDRSSKKEQDSYDDKGIEDDKLLIGAITAITIFIFAMIALISIVILLKQHKRRNFSLVVGEPLLMNVYKKSSDQNEAALTSLKVDESDGHSKNASSEKSPDDNLPSEKNLENAKDLQNDPFITEQGEEIGEGVDRDR